MNYTKYLTLLLVAFILGACNKSESTYVRIEPAKVEHIENSHLSNLELTERAIERIGVKTGKVTEEVATKSSNNTQIVVPYSAILYEANGESWVYTNPKPRNYVRHQVKIDYISDGKTFLTEGPPAGTTVVTQGAVELLGTEFHVGH